MPNKLTIVLSQPEYSGLMRVAVAELRDPRDQLRVILRRELARRGLMAPGAAFEEGESDRADAADSVTVARD